MKASFHEQQKFDNMEANNNNRPPSSSNESNASNASNASKMMANNDSDLANVSKEESKTPESSPIEQAELRGQPNEHTVIECQLQGDKFPKEGQLDQGLLESGEKKVLQTSSKAGSDTVLYSARCSGDVVKQQQVDREESNQNEPEEEKSTLKKVDPSRGRAQIKNNSKQANNNNNNNNILSASTIELTNGNQQSIKAKSTTRLQAAPAESSLSSLASREEEEVIIGNKEFYCKRRKLNYIQSLLLRKWPCLPLSIFIMASLLFGILLSILSVYLMHDFTDCSLGFALKASPIDMSLPHDSIRRPADVFETAPIESASGLGEQLSARLISAQNDTSSQVRQLPTAAAAAAAAASNQQLKFRRLPASLWPVHYDLFIQPFIMEPFYFNGKVLIKIKCTEPSDNITLHTHDLKINQDTLSLKLAALDSGADLNSSHQAIGQSSQLAKVTGLSEDKELQYSIIHLDKQLEVGQEYALGIEFVGNLNDDLAGFYKIKYERQNSSEITWVAATQFQATDARRAFPCFDEPLYKATFSIQIKHWKNMTALSNMPIIDRQDSSDGLWVTDTFEKSHRMSTYLVAFAVTNFESRSEGNISVWTRPGFGHSAEYALKIAGKILRHYENFFGIEYPLPKMDMIALPDFNAGAMENWGLITYRETAMLYDESSSSIGNKQRVAVVVAHELAHQWFGNLVTPKWWDDLWLNEGFASYVEYIGVDHVEPKWQMLDQFVVEEVQNVFKMDSLSSSHQISIPVNNPDEISEIFDHISYSKGSSIIRMMSHFLTEDIFKAGLRRYLKALKYDNAEQKDLWAHLTEAQRLANLSNVIDVEQVMNSWTLQTGYPLVTLTRLYDGTKAAKVEQTRHKTNRNLKSTTTTTTTNLSDSIQKWEIPLTYTSKSESNWSPITRFWLHQTNNDSELAKIDELPVKDNDDWILLNLNQVGYYRVNYDLNNWKLIINQLNEDHKKIKTVNRAQLLDDMFELAKSGLLDYKFVMDATKYIKRELDFLPFDSMFMSIAYIDDMLQRTPLYGDWRDYLVQLLTPYYNRYKESDWTIGGQTKSSAKNLASNSTPEAGQTALMMTGLDDPNDVLAQYNLVNAISWGCQVEEHCIMKAKSLFKDWKLNGKNVINPALRYTVYCTSIENGSKSDWNFLWKIYTKEQNASERDRILRALACSKELWVLSRYLEWTFDKTKPIRRQDGAFVFRSISKNNYGRDLAFNFMRERWSTIKETYGKTSFSMGHLIRSISNSMNTNTELTQLKAFYEQIKVDVGTGKRAFLIAIEEVESNIAWRERSYKILEDWLSTAAAAANSNQQSKR